MGAREALSLTLALLGLSFTNGQPGSQNMADKNGRVCGNDCVGAEAGGGISGRDGSHGPVPRTHKTADAPWYNTGGDSESFAACRQLVQTEQAVAEFLGTLAKGLPPERHLQLPRPQQPRRRDRRIGDSLLDLALNQ